MRKHKIISTIVLAAVITILISMAGCAKDDTVVIGNSVAVTKTVSFTTDLIPLFTKNCALSGCHVKGSVAPDLEAATAYSQLSSMGLYNTGSPTSSVIYQRLMGLKTPAMPLGSPTNPDNINGYVLAWITQGANNN